MRFDSAMSAAGIDLVHQRPRLVSTMNMWSLALLCLLISAAGCGQGETDTADSEPATEPAGSLPEEKGPKKITSSGPRTVEGKVLRHVVFFSFKPESSDDDVAGVVNAFAALPDKIDTIVDFQYGENRGPEQYSAGLTHCFLLSFNNADHRDEYIPHPAHAGEFADVLRPHMDQVFVIDYWGVPHERLENELLHAVFFKFKEGLEAAQIEAVENQFAALPGEIAQIKHFEWGKNNSPEKNDRGFTHCFLLGFASEEDLAAYDADPKHQAFAKGLADVVDEVRVLDFWGQRP